MTFFLSAILCDQHVVFNYISLLMILLQLDVINHATFIPINMRIFNIWEQFLDYICDSVGIIGDQLLDVGMYLLPLQPYSCTISHHSLGHAVSKVRGIALVWVFIVKYVNKSVVVLKANSCMVDGLCYVEGQTTGRCALCDPAYSTVRLRPLTGALMYCS